MDLAILKNELVTDPLGRGYAGMNDKQAADDMNIKNRQLDLHVTPTSVILANMVFSEYAALTPDQKQWLGFMFTCTQIDVSTGTETRNALLAMFPGGSPGSVTRTKIQAALTNLVGRGEEIGIGFVRPGDVTMARAS